MAYSYVTYPGDGEEDTFSLTFDYIAKAHVTATVDGVAKTFTWPSESTIQMDAVPGEGESLVITRNTPKDAREVDFTNVSLLDEETLDKDANQLFFIAQEAFDRLATALQYDIDTGEYDADNKRIKNLAAGVSDDEACRVGQMSGFVTDAETAQAAAETAQAAAETAQGAAETAQGAAETAQTAAETAQAAAETAETNAETAQAAAETAQGLAETAQTAAETAETNAETAETGAVAAQGAAETAQGLAETAKTAAETAETNAETAQAAAETAQGLAETAKTAAETAETNAETAETNAETAEANAVTAQNAAETAQAAAEAAQAAAEACIPTISDDGPAGGNDGDLWYEY